jgi:hypothetical protein
LSVTWLRGVGLGDPEANAVRLFEGTLGVEGEGNEDIDYFRVWFAASV